MSAEALFLGIELLVWLAIGLIAWAGVCLRRPSRATLPALGVSLLVALVAGPLPGLLGWRSLGGLLFGLGLAGLCATAAAWQTTKARAKR